MKVLIGIITRNRAEFLPLAIRSALAQDYPNKEVVVLDIASTDATPDVRAEFPDIGWHRLKERIGIPESRNWLMQKTDAAYFVSLDDDAWFLRHDEISIGVQCLETNRALAAVAYDVLLPGDTPSTSRGTPRPCAIFIGCGHVLRLSDVAAVHYYAPNPTVYGGSEESDLCLRLFELGRGVIFLPGVHVWHERTMTGRNVLEQYRHNVCNELVSLFRRCPAIDLIWITPLRLASHLRFALSRRWVGSYLRALGLFCRCLPGVIQSRQPVKAHAFRKFLRFKQGYS